MAKEKMYRINSLPGMRKAKSNNVQNNSKPKVKKEY